MPDNSSLLRQEGPQQEDRLQRIRQFWNKPPAPAVCVVCQKPVAKPKYQTAGGMFYMLPCQHCGSRAGWTSVFTTGGRDAKADIHYLLAALEASTPNPKPEQQERTTSLIARLRDYHDQVLKGFRHISRVEEADLIQAAIDGLRQKDTPMARLRGSLPAEESDAEFNAAIAQIRAVPPAEGETK